MVRVQTGSSAKDALVLFKCLLLIAVELPGGEGVDGDCLLLELALFLQLSVVVLLCQLHLAKSIKVASELHELEVRSVPRLGFSNADDG